ATDKTGPDRLHAIEALAKLRVSLRGDTKRSIERWMVETSGDERPFGHWLLALSTNDSAAFACHREALISGLDSERPLRRLRSAYALLQFNQPLSSAHRELILRAGERAAAAQPSDETTDHANAQVLTTFWREAKHNGPANLVVEIRSAFEKLTA